MADAGQRARVAIQHAMDYAQTVDATDHAKVDVLQHVTEDAQVVTQDALDYAMDVQADVKTAADAEAHAKATAKGV